MRVYRRRGQRYHRYASTNVQEIGRPVLYGGGSRMVWCTIRFGWKCCLAVVDGNLTAQRYIDEILRNDVTPLFANSPNDMIIIMQDNARPHAAGHQCQYSTLATLFTTHEPNRTPMGSSGSSDSEIAYPQHRINRLVMSMQRRLRSMIASRGHRY